MSAGALTSDHVNYLIWRYLQESGHGEAAVKLQRDWIPDPQTLPFAQHIKTHALVVLVQKGLQYYEIEQSMIQNGTRSSLSSTSFFGPRSVRATLSPKEDVSEEEAGTSQFSPRSRKHGRESTANGLLLDLPTPAPPAKRSRRSNGTEGTNGNGRGSDSMDYEFTATVNEANVNATVNTSTNANANANDANGTVHGPGNVNGNENGNENGNGNGNGNGNENGQSRPEAPEPTSNINSPAAESQSQSQIGADGAGGMDVDDDAPVAEHQHNNINNNKQQQQQQAEDDEQEEEEEVEEEGEEGEEDLERQEQRQQQQQEEHEQEQDQEQEQQEHDEHARISLRVTLTNGHSVGVQSDQVSELGETITLTVPDKNVLHTAWNPRDAAILATGGDALCRIWNAQSELDSSSPNNPPYVDILNPSDHSSVTAMAWSHDGNVLAVCARSDTLDPFGAVSLWSKSGRAMDHLPVIQGDMVLTLRWNASGTHLLGVTSSGRETSSLVVWDTRNSHSLPPFQLDHVIRDAAWLDDTNFVICGHGIIAESTVYSDAITGFQTRDDVDTTQRWSHIKYDTATRIIAFVAEESAMLAIIDSSTGLRTTTAHSAEITALAFQPLSSPAANSPISPRLLVTSSLDGNIKVWDARNPFTTIHVLSLGRAGPAMSFSFAPDGFLVAAASWNRILIWNAEAGDPPKARWNGGSGKWQALTNGVDQDSGIGEEDDGPQHSLSWDADGKKLAYGLGNQISILSVRP